LFVDWNQAESGGRLVNRRRLAFFLGVVNNQPECRAARDLF